MFKVYTLSNIISSLDRILKNWQKVFQETTNEYHTNALFHELSELIHCTENDNTEGLILTAEMALNRARLLEQNEICYFVARLLVRLNLYAGKYNDALKCWIDLKTNIDYPVDVYIDRIPVFHQLVENDFISEHQNNTYARALQMFNSYQQEKDSYSIRTQFNNLRQIQALLRYPPFNNEKLVLLDEVQMKFLKCAFYLRLWDVTISVCDDILFRNITDEQSQISEYRNIAVQNLMDEKENINKNLNAMQEVGKMDKPFVEALQNIEELLPAFHTYFNPDLFSSLHKYWAYHLMQEGADTSFITDLFIRVTTIWEMLGCHNRDELIAYNMLTGIYHQLRIKEISEKYKLKKDNIISYYDKFNQAAIARACIEFANKIVSNH